MRTTIWLAVFAWAATEILKSRGRPNTARVVWTSGAALLAIHIALAFHYWHGWSHAAAYESTALQSAQLTGVASGWGIYLNYALLAVWIADAAWWWGAPRAYAGRSRALDRAVFAFFLFMMINGAVVFATTAMRYAGAVAVIAAIAARVRPTAAPSPAAP
jgi:hypothetical protein